MTVGLKRFEQILDAYGADPSRWPEGERAQAEAFLAGSAEAQAMAQGAHELDGWLNTATAHAPSELLQRRVLKAAPGAPRHVFGWASGAGWAAAAAAGLVLGLSVGQQMILADQADQAIEQATSWSVDEAEYFG